MAQLSKELALAIEADDAGRLDKIIERGDEADYQVLQALVVAEGTSEAYRRKALYALGRWGKPEAVAQIREVLPQLSELERISAVNALGRLGTAEALEVILSFSEDPSPDVRRFVVGALGQVNSPEAVAAIRQIAEADEVDFVRELAQQKLDITDK